MTWDMTGFRFALAALLLAGCAGDPTQFAVQPETSEVRIRSSARTISLAEVSLPGYTEEARFTVEDAAGAVVPLSDAVWADTPERVMTTALVRNLAAITGAQVAADPWPLDGVPEAEVRVRVERMTVTQANIFILSGQYAVRRDEVTSKNRLEQFAITVPVAALTPGDVLKAHDAAWRRLSETLAKAL